MSEDPHPYTTDREDAPPERTASVPNLANVSPERVSMFLTAVLRNWKTRVHPHVGEDFERVCVDADWKEGEADVAESVCLGDVQKGGGWSEAVQHVGMLRRMSIQDFATDPALTPALIEAMGERGWRWGGATAPPVGLWLNSFRRFDPSFRDHAGQADSFPLAVARAAVRALWDEASPEARALITESTPTEAGRSTIDTDSTDTAPDGA